MKTKPPETVSHVLRLLRQSRVPSATSSIIAIPSGLRPSRSLYCLYGTPEEPCEVRGVWNNVALRWRFEDYSLKLNMWEPKSCGASDWNRKVKTAVVALCAHHVLDSGARVQYTLVCRTVIVGLACVKLEQVFPIQYSIDTDSHHWWCQNSHEVIRYNRLLVPMHGTAINSKKQFFRDRLWRT